MCGGTCCSLDWQLAAMGTRREQFMVIALLLAARAFSNSNCRPVAAQLLGQPTYAGYIPISSKDGSSMYYAYWDATSPSQTPREQPIILWLQGGPGCASTFGAFYELGPAVLADDAKKPKPNPWSLNKNNGLLVIDQPIGTGYSVAASETDIPTDMLGMAQDLYAAIWGFFDEHKELQQRPFFIAGESYAGKYVPSISHYILHPDSWRGSAATSIEHISSTETPRRKQRPASGLRLQWQEQPVGGSSSSSSNKQVQPMAVDRGVPSPNFKLAGIAIGNGLTDPIAQTRALPSIIYNMGLITEATRKHIQDQVEVIVQQVDESEWPQAADKRSQLIDYIQNASGVATLLDIRRTAQYDPGERVQQLLNSSEYKTMMQADPRVDYSSCSSVVEKVLAPDTMKSASHLVEDILGTLPVLLYQGQFDGQDGVASSNAWISNLKWKCSREFAKMEGDLWYVDGVAAGWNRSVSTLTQVVIRNAGHMVPTDQPQATQQMFDTWIAGVLQPAPQAKESTLQQSGLSSNTMVV